MPSTKSNSGFKRQSQRERMVVAQKQVENQYAAQWAAATSGSKSSGASGSDDNVSAAPAQSKEDIGHKVLKIVDVSSTAKPVARGAEILNPIPVSKVMAAARPKPIGDTTDAGLARQQRLVAAPLPAENVWVKKYQSDKAAGKLPTMVAPTPVVEVQAKVVPKATPFQEPVADKTAAEPRYVPAPLPAKNAWKEKRRSDVAAGKLPIKVAPMLEAKVSAKAVPKTTPESVVKVVPESTPKKLEEQKDSVAKSTATADNKKDAWTEVAAKKKPATSKATTQKPTKTDKVTDTVFAALAGLPSASPNASSVAAPRQQETVSIEKTKPKKKRVLKADKKKLEEAQKAEKKKLEEAKALDDLVAAIENPKVALAQPLPQQPVSSNGGAAATGAANTTSAEPAKTVNVPKVAVQTRADKRKQARIDTAVAAAKDRALTEAAMIDVSQKDLAALVAGAKHHRDNKLASEAKFRRALKTLDEKNFPLSLLDGSDTAPRAYRDGAPLSKEHQGLLGTALVLQRVYRGICKDIALVAHANQLLGLRAIKANVELRSASASSSDKTEVDSEEFPTVPVVVPLEKSSSQMVSTPVWAQSSVTPPLSTPKTFEFSNAKDNSKDADTSSALEQQSIVAGEHLAIAPLEAGKSIFDILAKSTHATEILEQNDVVDTSASTAVDQLDDKVSSSTAVTTIDHPPKVAISLAVAIKTSERIYTKPIGPPPPPVKVAICSAGPGAR